MQPGDDAGAPAAPARAGLPPGQQRPVPPRRHPRPQRFVFWRAKSDENLRWETWSCFEGLYLGFISLPSDGIAYIAQVGQQLTTSRDAILTSCYLLLLAKVRERSASPPPSLSVSALAPTLWMSSVLGAAVSSSFFSIQLP